MNWWFLKSKIHTVWYFVFICSGFIVGILLINFINFPTDLSLILIILSSFILIIYLPKRFVYIVPIIIICGVVLGLIRGQVFQDKLACVNSFKGQAVFIKAKVEEDFSSLDNSFKAESSAINNINCQVSLYVNFKDSNLEGFGGDIVTFQGFLSDGFGDFSGVVNDLSNFRIINKQGRNVILDFKNQFSENIKEFLPEPHSSMGLGYLIGQQTDLPIMLTFSLQAVGLTHIIVASGYNLSIIVRLSRRLFARVSKYLSFIVSIIFIAVFILMAGLTPSVFRASLVSFMSLAAWYYGRRFHPVSLIIFTMAITVFINPNFILGDIGWQLSFLAFAGVMILAPLLGKYLFGEQKINTVFQILIETFSAQIMTLPIILINFGQLSYVAIIANLLVLPFIPIIMIFVFLLGLMSYINSIFGYILALPTKLLIDYVIKVVEILSDLPWASQSISISIYQLIIFYFLIMTIVIYLCFVTKYKLRNTNLVE